MLKLELLLILYAVKNNGETRVKQRWYYKYLPVRAAKGFTLAEVLITLLVIGIVASMVIPALIHDTQQQEYKATYKKAFADVSNALKQCISNNELSSCSGKWDLTCHQTNFTAIKAKFVIVKECTTNRTDCWADGGNFFSLPELHNASSFIDNDGRSWADGLDEPWIFVDTNGLKGPNVNGLDRFVFIPVSDNKINYSNLDISSSLIGTPVKIAVEKDWISSNPNMCPTGKCYNTSWLQ